MIPFRSIAMQITVLASFLLVAGCGDPAPPAGGTAEPLAIESDGRGRFTLRFDTMGTHARIVAVATDDAAAREAIENAVDAVRSVAATMSTYDPESEISRLNRDGAQRPVELSAGSMRVLREAVRFSNLTGGAFDVTYAPLRTLWRRAEKQGAVPADEEITAALETVGAGRLRLTGSVCAFGAPGMEVDLGGIAKGFAIDLACEALSAAGIERGLVDIGGDLRVLGSRPGDEPWKILINDPRGGDHPALVLHLSDCSVATSGDYQRFFTVDGQRFSHIVDPRSGRPVDSVPSATVIAPDALTADALATAISVLGPEAALPIVESLDRTECMIMSSARDKGVEIFKSSAFDSSCESK